MKEAERQRTVKLTAADWIDHPDRYLLELGTMHQHLGVTKYMRLNSFVWKILQVDGPSTIILIEEEHS